MEEEKPEDKLTESQKVFCEEYIKDYNGTRSYQVAYPEVTYDSSRVLAHNLLTNVNIRAYLSDLKQRTAELAGVSPLSIANELKKLAFSSISRLRTNWITRAEYDSISQDDKDAIQEIDTKILQKNIGTDKEPEIVDVEYVKIKLFDKVRALENLSKMFGYNEPDSVRIETDGINFILPNDSRSK